MDNSHDLCLRSHHPRSRDPATQVARRAHQSGWPDAGCAAGGFDHSGHPCEAGENAAGAALAMDLRKRRARF